MTGILFLVLTARLFAADLSLAEQFFQEGNWAECILESQRTLFQSPSNETALLLHATATLHAGSTNCGAALSNLLYLSSQATLPEHRAQAASSAAWIQLRQNRLQEAWNLAEMAFLTATSSPVFFSSGALLLHLMREHPAYAKPSAPLRLQLEACAPTLSEVAPPAQGAFTPAKSTSLLAQPGKWIVAFYRSTIRPAIGARCSLTPSCSEYFLQASYTHKLLGIPMIADRLVREPGEVNYGHHPVDINGVTFYEDPLKNHDYWLSDPP
jgi:putative component of membrane protein insertase Oxa1/YidC/SpoIIIJ protein YidD